MNNTSYWEGRAAADEARAQKIARRYMKEEKKLYKEALEQINGKIDRLYTKIRWGGADTVTRTELWEYSHYINLRDEILDQCKMIGEGQVTLTEACINEVYQKTLGVTIADATELTRLTNFGTKKVLNSVWSGENFSTRIYKNTNTLAARLNQHISDMVVLGKSPEEIKKQVIAEFNTSYYQADRLIRTETSYTFNTAALDRYKQKGVKKVEVLVEKSACDRCLDLKEKQFTIEAAPFLPMHPNCRCCYLPIID